MVAEGCARAGGRRVKIATPAGLAPSGVPPVWLEGRWDPEASIYVHANPRHGEEPRLRPIQKKTRNTEPLLIDSITHTTHNSVDNPINTYYAQTLLASNDLGDPRREGHFHIATPNAGKKQTPGRQCANIITYLMCLSSTEPAVITDIQNLCGNRRDTAVLLSSKRKGPGRQTLACLGRGERRAQRGRCLR